MFRFSYILVFIVSLSTLHAQVGISGSYLNGQADNWQNISSFNNQTIDLPGKGWQVGIDYWFRLKNVRIEFLPTLALSRQEQTIALNTKDLDTRMQGYHFFFNTNIYFLDLPGDCDCPTWSKEGPTLQKGIYLQVSPGMSYLDYTITDKAFDTKTEYTSNNTAFSLGIGLGFDLGLSDFLTITPQIGARYYPSAEWASLNDEPNLAFPEGVTAESKLLQYHVGLRLGFRLD